MQTFLPCPDFHETAACLDRQRLGKQRVEALQILNALTIGNRWANHPAVRMWKGYELRLAEYGLIICDRWIDLGYRDTCRDKIVHLVWSRLRGRNTVPPWLGDPAFHAAHRAALLYKDPDWYGQFGWTEEPAVPNDKGSLPYVWPAQKKETET